MSRRERRRRRRPIRPGSPLPPLVPRPLSAPPPHSPQRRPLVSSGWRLWPPRRRAGTPPIRHRRRRRLDIWPASPPSPRLLPGAPRTRRLSNLVLSAPHSLDDRDAYRLGRLAGRRSPVYGGGRGGGDGGGRRQPSKWGSAPAEVGTAGRQAPAREAKTASCPQSSVSHGNSKDDFLTRVSPPVLAQSCDTHAPRW